jgi:hypothetical protein
MEITFGKFKGSTVEQLAKSEEGSKWLQWWVEKGLDVNDPKWGAKNAERKAEVLKIWNAAKNDKQMATNSPAPVVSAVGESKTLHQMALKIDVIDKKLTEIHKQIEAVTAILANKQTPEDIEWSE